MNDFTGGAVRAIVMNRPYLGLPRRSLSAKFNSNDDGPSSAGRELRPPSRVIDFALRRTPSRKNQAQERVTDTSQGNVALSPASWNRAAEITPSKVRNEEWLEGLGFDMASLKVSDVSETENVHPNNRANQPNEPLSEHRRAQQHSAFTTPNRRPDNKFPPRQVKSFMYPSPRGTAARYQSPSPGPKLPPSRSSLFPRRLEPPSPSATDEVSDSSSSMSRITAESRQTPSRACRNPDSTRATFRELCEFFEAGAEHGRVDDPYPKHRRPVSEASMPNLRCLTSRSSGSTPVRMQASRSFCNRGYRSVETSPREPRREVVSKGDSRFETWNTPRTARRSSQVSPRRDQNPKTSPNAASPENSKTPRSAHKNTQCLSVRELRSLPDTNGQPSEAIDNIRWSANRVKQELCSVFGDEVRDGPLEESVSAVFPSERQRRGHRSLGTEVRLTPVRASRRQRELLGTDTVLTPVRRSTRKSQRKPNAETEAGSALVVNKKLLESTGYAYVPNPRLEESIVEEPADSQSCSSSS